MSRDTHAHRAAPAGAAAPQNATPGYIGSGVWRRRRTGPPPGLRPATIVEYTDRTPPRNDYPVRIVSPLLPAPCCASAMAEIGDPQTDGLLLFQYRRCPVCGFTVRKILAKRLGQAWMNRLRTALVHSLVRRVEE